MAIYVIFSQNSWNSQQRYQRHRLAEYLCTLGSHVQVIFVSKAFLRGPGFSSIVAAMRRMGTRIIRNLGPKNVVDTPQNLLLKNVLWFPYFGPHWLQRAQWRRIARNIERDLGGSIGCTVITYQPVEEILELRKWASKVVYVSVHDYENMDGVSQRVVEAERRLIRQVDYFTTDSADLYRKLTGVRPTFCLRPACSDVLVKASLNERDRVRKVATLAYFGTIAEYLDWAVLKEVANAGYKLLFIGNNAGVDIEKKLKSTEFTWKPAAPIESMAEYLKSCDALIVPYKVNDRNDLVFPAKIYEYWALGMPIFSPSMKWNKEYEIKEALNIYRDTAELLTMLKSVNLEILKRRVEAGMKLAGDNTWDKRFSQFLLHLEK